MKKHILNGGLVAASLFATAISHAVTVGKINDTTLSIGGYVKLDAMMSSYSDGTLGPGNLGRDFYVPSLVPVGGEDENTTTDIHARQSRINFVTTTDLGEHKLKTFIELGFLASAGGNERITNSYSPRMRHAFFTYDKWLFGQTWTTFQNVGALPETADFIGNTDFGIFARQAQIRYTNGNWQFAIENPETTVLGVGATDDNELPDFIGRYNYSGGDLSLTTAVLLRQLTYNNGATIDSSTSSVGFSLSGKYKLGEDDIRFGVNTGSGMGRYIGLNVAAGAAVDAGGDLEAIDSTAYYFAYRHFWNSQWRSNFTYSAIDIDNDTDITGENVTSSTNSLRANIFYSPVKSLSLGWEIAIADRELESGNDGGMNRLQFTAKLGF